MLKNWPVVALAVILIAVFVASCYTNPSQNNQQRCATNNSPVAGGVKEQAQCYQKGEAPSSPPGLRRAIAWPEGVTALGVFLTLFFIAWQAILMREAIVASEGSAKQELRAYLSVRISGGSYQDRANGIKFDGVPILINIGKTPAHDVRYWTNSAVLKDPIAEDYVMPYGKKNDAGYTIGMNQEFTFRVIAEDYIDSKDVPDVMSGTKGKAFYYWGEIEYHDVFGDSHTVVFCHRLYFTPDSKNKGKYNVAGNYIPSRNKET